MFQYNIDLFRFYRDVVSNISFYIVTIYYEPVISENNTNIYFTFRLELSTNPNNSSPNGMDNRKVRFEFNAIYIYIKLEINKTI